MRNGEEVMQGPAPADGGGGQSPLRAVGGGGKNECGTTAASSDRTSGNSVIRRIVSCLLSIVTSARCSSYPHTVSLSLSFSVTLCQRPEDRLMNISPVTVHRQDEESSPPHPWRPSSPPRCRLSTPSRLPIEQPRQRWCLTRSVLVPQVME